MSSSVEGLVVGVIRTGSGRCLGFGRSAVGMEVGPVLLSPRERSGEGIK
jgi:hypothetical protein